VFIIADYQSLRLQLDAPPVECVTISTFGVEPLLPDTLLEKALYSKTFAAIKEDGPKRTAKA